MLGAIAGDIIGSVYENSPIKTQDFPLFSKKSVFTDDTVMTVAIADALISGAEKDQNLYVKKMQEYGLRYPDAGYGGMFRQWLAADKPRPYNSFGNGSAMRVSPVGFFFDDTDKVLEQAYRSAAVTHDHPEGIKGARAVAVCINMASNGLGKEAIKDYISQHFAYDLERSLEDIRPGYRFDPTCQGSVPESIIAFLQSENFEDAVRKAVSLGGDSDTMACIAGSIAEAYYGRVPDSIAEQALDRLDENLKIQVERFYSIIGKQFQFA